MTRVRGAFAITFAIAAVGAGYFVFRYHGGEQPAQLVDIQSKPAVPTWAQVAPVTPHAEAMVGRHVQTANVSSGDYRKAFVRASNYYDFVRSSTGAAREGNPEAQFYISEALSYCDWGYGAFFRKSPDGPATSLEEAIGRFTVYFPNAVGFIRDVYKKCHVLMENDITQWGKKEEWLTKATAAGLPAAQARAAEWVITAQTLHQPLPIESAPDPRTLLRDAVQTKDPAALFMAGELHGALDPGRDARLVGGNVSNSDDGTESEDKLAWWLLACSHGYDCSDKAPWYERVCVTDSRCQVGETGEDYIHQIAQRHNYNLEQRAQELEAKLDAGAWTDLGLEGGT